MNLSALNKLPLNGLSASAAEASSPDTGLSRLPVHSLSGADFASYLQNHVQALKNTQRQDVAALPVPLPPAHAEPHTEHLQQPADKRDTKLHNRAADNTDTGDEAAADKARQARTSAHIKVDAVRTSAHIKANQEGTADGQQQNNMQTAATASADGLSDQADAANSQQALSDKASDLSSQPGALTTIALSDKLQIITTAQTTPSEKSVADFALAMGLDPSQVQALFGSGGAASANAPLKTGLTTQDMLGLNTLPAFISPEQGNLKGLDTAPAATPGMALNTPVSSADFQALQHVSDPTNSQADQSLLAKMDNVQIQVGTAQAQLTTAPPPPSTLSVLSMMDATLRAEDIESLKNEFDALQAAPATDSLNLTPGADFSAGGQRNTAHAATPAAQVFANNPDMAQTYENLSQKLTTELAARMHEKLNAGEWKMKFALKPASLGLVDVQLEMRDGKLTAQFQSDTPLTQDLIQNGSQRLKDALSDMGMGNASVLVGEGQSQSAGQSGQGSPQGQTGLPAKREENRAKLTEEPGPKIAKGSAPGRNTRSQFDSYA